MTTDASDEIIVTLNIIIIIIFKQYVNILFEHNGDHNIQGCNDIITRISCQRMERIGAEERPKRFNCSIYIHNFTRTSLWKNCLSLIVFFPHPPAPV